MGEFSMSFTERKRKPISLPDNTTKIIDKEKETTFSRLFCPLHKRKRRYSTGDTDYIRKNQQLHKKILRLHNVIEDSKMDGVTSLYPRNHPVSGALNLPSTLKKLNFDDDHKSKRKHVNEFILSNIEDVPPIWRMPGILTGYRLYFSYYNCFKSIFRIHNETGSIWTHILGFILFYIFACTTAFTFQTVKYNELFIDYMVFLIYYIMATFAMFLSVFHHTFFCHSMSTYSFTLRLDFCGVILLVGAHYPPAMYLFFYCDPSYFLVATVFIATLTIYSAFLIMSNVIREKLTFRISVFLILLIASVFPIFLCYSVFFSQSYEIRWLFGIPVLFGGSIYLLGFFFFVTGFPERYFIGKFDNFCSSHQIWHLLVVAAVVYFAHVFSKFYEWRVNTPCDM